MIVTGWHQLYGESQYSLDNIWPGDGLIDVLGFDIYNQYGLTKSGSTSTTTTDLATSYLPQITAFANMHGVDWGLAETAFTDLSAADDPQWLTRTYGQVADAGGVAVSYFNTVLNSTGTWVIASTSKTTLYAQTLAGAPRLN